MRNARVDIRVAFERQIWDYRPEWLEKLVISKPPIVEVGTFHEYLKRTGKV